MNKEQREQLASDLLAEAEHRRGRVVDLLRKAAVALCPPPAAQVQGEQKPERCQYQRGTIECRGDGYLWDADCDGYDPADHSMPCPSCNPVNYLEQAKEEAESTVDFASMGTRGTGEDIWLWAVERVRHECPEGVDAALAKVGQVLALVPAENNEGCAERLHNAPPAAGGPEGYALVPLKPTIEMVEAGYEASLGQPDRSAHARVIEQYDAMLAAAPTPPASEQQQAVVMEELLTRVADWCDKQPKHDWYGRTAGDMVRTFMARQTTPPQENDL